MFYNTLKIFVAGQKVPDPQEDSKLGRLLKESVMTRKFTDVKDTLPLTTLEKAKQLEEFQQNLLSHRRMQTYIECLMGRNLCSIKNETGKKNVDLVKYVQPYSPRSYTRSDIFFMMNLFLLSEQYPRLSFVTVGTGKLKSKFKIVKRVMEKEAVYWRNLN